MKSYSLPLFPFPFLPFFTPFLFSPSFLLKILIPKSPIYPHPRAPFKHYNSLLPLWNSISIEVSRGCWIKRKSQDQLAYTRPKSDARSPWVTVTRGLSGFRYCDYHTALPMWLKTWGLRSWARSIPGMIRSGFWIKIFGLLHLKDLCRDAFLRVCCALFFEAFEVEVSHLEAKYPKIIDFLKTVVSRHCLYNPYEGLQVQTGIGTLCIFLLSKSMYMSKILKFPRQV